MRVLAVGGEPVGVIAIGANATGIVAVGQLATGVVAIGQLARGVVTIGQLAVGVAAVGQLAIGAVWSSGMLAAGATVGPGLLKIGLFGRLYLSRLFGRAAGPVVDWSPRRSAAGLGLRVVVAVGITALWWFSAGHAVVDALIRRGGILRSPPRTFR